MLYEIFHPIKSLRGEGPKKKGFLFPRVEVPQKTTHTWADVARLAAILGGLVFISTLVPSPKTAEEQQKGAAVTAEFKFTESYEDYIEAVLILTRRKGFARSVDVADYLHVRAQSVSTALKTLNTEGYLVFSDDGHITLTEDGMNIAKNVYQRHVVMSALLEKSGIPASLAWEDGGKMAHKMSESTASAIQQFVGDIADKAMLLEPVPLSADAKEGAEN